MNITLKSLIGSALTVLALSAGNAYAQSKAAFISIDRVLKEVESAKQAQSKLKSEFSAREQELMAQQTSIKAAIDKFEKESKGMSDAQRAPRERQLMEQDQQFQLKQRQFQEDLAVRKNEEIQKVLDAANGVVKRIAESEKIDFVLQEAVYVNPSLDITQKVISAMNGR